MPRHDKNDQEIYILGGALFLLIATGIVLVLLAFSESIPTSTCHQTENARVLTRRAAPAITDNVGYEDILDTNESGTFEG